MFLKGELIYLRALEPEDAEILYKWENDMRLWEVSFTQVPFSRFVLEEFVNAAHNDIYTNKQLRLICCSNETGEPVGIVDLFEFEPQHARCGLGIFVDEAFRGQGFAAEAVALAKDYGFSVLHLKQFYVHVNASNPASLALFENAGFAKSGLKKSWNRARDNRFEDVWFLQCLNERLT